MAGKSYKYVSLETSITGAISTFYSEIEELAGEAREIVDNASDGLAETARIQTFGETADTLENLQEVDSPFDNAAADSDAAKLGATSTSVSVASPKNKRANTSRAVRLENACSYGRAGVEAVRSWCDEQESELGEAETGNPEGVSEGALALVASMRTERETLIEELREYADEVEGNIEEAEGVEFPGMYG